MTVVSEVDIMMRFRCAYCGSMPGARCERATGEVLYGTCHADRYWQARKIGLLPLRDAEHQGWERTR